MLTGTSLRGTGHSNNVLACALSPDGSKAASGGSDKKVMIWDVATGLCCDSRGCSIEAKRGCMCVRPCARACVPSAPGAVFMRLLLFVTSCQSFLQRGQVQVGRVSPTWGRAAWCSSGAVPVQSCTRAAHWSGSPSPRLLRCREMPCAVSQDACVLTRLCTQRGQVHSGCVCVRGGGPILCGLWPLQEAASPAHFGPLAWGKGVSPFPVV